MFVAGVLGELLRATLASSPLGSEILAGAGVGGDVISLISASMSLILMSWGESFPCWAISASVLVRSTRVSRPSVEERRRRVKVAELILDGGAREGEYMLWWGAKSRREG